MPASTDVTTATHNRMRSSAAGSVAAQASQALGSFILQYLTARLLGLEALGRFAVVYAMIVLVTALSSGFVGDSLTVLDRAQPRIRAALQLWTGVIAGGAALICTAASWWSGFLDPAAAVVFGLATAAFVVEDLIRRMLMATMNFWRIVVVDVTALSAALAVLGIVALRGEIAFSHILLALTIGQMAGFAVGVAFLPPTERFFVSPDTGGMRTVAAFGIWRALQQGLRAATMAVMRVLLLLAVTTTAVGQLELARIYMAPAALLVTGIGSFLFATYAIAQGSVADLLRVADRTVARVFVTVGLVGVVAVAAVPFAGHLFTGDDSELSVAAVAAWAALAATTASVMPYAQLASVRGRHRAVFAIRLVESLASLLLMYVVVSATDTADWAPLVLAVCAIPAGFVIRHFLLVRPSASFGAAQCAIDRISASPAGRPMGLTIARAPPLASSRWPSLARFRREAALLSNEPCEQ
jgi:O-antigen/teichoic acid export membrane protein